MDLGSYNRQCTICDNYFPSRVSLAQHTKKHEDSFEHRCTYCDMGPYSIKFLKEHERSHTVMPEEEDDGWRVEQRCKCCPYGVFWADDPNSLKEHDLLVNEWGFERRCKMCSFGPRSEKVIRNHEARHEEFEDEELLKEEEDGEDSDEEIKEIHSDDDEIEEVYNDEDGDEDYDDDDDEIEVLPVEVIETEEDEIEEVYADEEIEEIHSDDEIQEIHEQDPAETLNNSVIFDFDDKLFEDYKPDTKESEEKMMTKQSNVEEDEIEEICKVNGIQISETRNIKNKEFYERTFNLKPKEIPNKFNSKANNINGQSLEKEFSNQQRKSKGQRQVKMETLVNDSAMKDDDFISVIEEDEIDKKDDSLRIKRQIFDKTNRWARVNEETKNYLMKVTGESETDLKNWFTKRRQLQAINAE